MQSDPMSRGSTSLKDVTDREWANEEPKAEWPGAPGAEASGASAKQRLSLLARTLESDVIPRLVQARRPLAANSGPSSAEISSTDVDSFVQGILIDTGADAMAAIDLLRSRGVSIETVYLDLLGPTARRLGEMWEEDLCDFSTVTVALGRLQRLLRELSPAFGTEVEHPANGRRALFVQPRDEQHSFGLSMVAEFFRRDGWDVIGGIGGAVANPIAMVRDEWVDVIGFSVGSDQRLPWLRETIASVRGASRNPALAVLVGGPPFVALPEAATEVGADGTARNGRDAPLVAENLVGRGRMHKK